jgi:hypothetical protein
MNINKKNFIGGVAAFLIVSALFTFLGVYDSNTMPFLKGFFFWCSTIGIATITGLLIFSWVFNGPLHKWSTPLKIIVLSAISSFPVVIVLAAHSGGLTGGWPAINWLVQYALTFPIAVVINSVCYLALNAMDLNPNHSEQSRGKSRPVEHFIKRLPLKYQSAELYAVSSEDHYLRVHTDRGEELILMRLSDALKELELVDGKQTHRSWWVARNGVTDTKSKSGKHSLVLKSGGIAPISRSFLKSVRESGYL